MLFYSRWFLIRFLREIRGGLESWGPWVLEVTLAITATRSSSSDFDPFFVFNLSEISKLLPAITPCTDDLERTRGHPFLNPVVLMTWPSVDTMVDSPP